MDVIEAIADCILRFEGWIPAGVDLKLPAGSRSWRNRNPGNLRPIANQPTAVDDKNYRVFGNLADGWLALRNDIMAKLAGSHGLTGDSTLRNFFDVYAPSDDSNDPDKYARQVARWLTAYTGRMITPQTRLATLKAID